MTKEAALEPLGRLVGAWTVEMTHPSLPGVVVNGTAEIEWLEGERFLIHRARTDHKDFPDSISIIGDMDQDRVEDAAAATEARLRMHYFDSRGVFRVYDASFDDRTWRLQRDAPGLAQRFTGTFADDGKTIAGRWQMCTDGARWNDDLQITYHRAAR